MNEAEARCFIGTMLGVEKQSRFVDDVEVERALGNDAHALGQYAEAASDWGRKVADEAVNANPNSVSAKVGAAFSQYTGVDKSMLTRFFGKPSEVLGEDAVRPVVELLQSHKAQFPNGDYRAYRAQVVPKLEQYRQMLSPQLSPAMQGYLKEWIESEKLGVSLYRKEAFIARGESNRNPIGVLTDNVIGNLISNNPTIALYNIFEIVPKAQAYAIQKVGPAQAQTAIMKAFADFMKATGGKFWARIPELEAKGVYQSTDLSWLGQKFHSKLGVSNLLDLTENPLRGISYLLGEALEQGGGSQAVEGIAFAYRPGNMPSMLWNREGTGTVQLMRFSIESMKMYGQLVKSLADPTKAANAAFALAAFHAVSAMQTGIQGSVPLPVWTALPQDTKDYLTQLSNDTPLLNVSQKAFGIDVAKATQPLGGVAFGVGPQILTTDLSQGVNKGLKGVGKIAEGDAESGALDLLQGAFTVGQAGKLPGVNLTTLRLLKAARKSYENNTDLGEETLDAFHLKPEEQD